MTVEQTVVPWDSPAAIVASVPELFGFVPEDSIVVVMCHGDNGRTFVGPLMRLDSDQISGLPAYLRQFRAQHPKYDQAIVLTYEPVMHDAEKWAAASCAVAQDAGFVVLDALAIADGRWRSVLCANPACCPPRGGELPVDQPAATELRAERIAAGHVTVGTRADLAALAEPAGEQIDPQTIVDAHQQRKIEIAQDGPSVWCARIIDRLARHIQAVADGAPAPGLIEDAPTFLDALSSFDVRDTICGWVGQTHLRPAVVEVMLRLARASQQRVVDPLCIAAVHAYADGNGALANICLDRAHHLQPDHTLTNLLTAYIELGEHPSTLTHLLEQPAES